MAIHALSYIGENSQITVGSIVCGSAILGRDCWLSPGSVIDNGVRIGDKSLINQTYSSLESLSSSKALPRISPKTDPEDLDPYFSKRLCSSSISNCLIERANFRFV